MSDKIGAVDGVAPIGVSDGDFLEQPGGIGAVAVGHVDGGFYGFIGERGEGLGE